MKINIPGLRWIAITVVAVGGLSLFVFLADVFVEPVLSGSRSMNKSIDAFADGRAGDAVNFAELAAKSDPLDPTAAADAARANWYANRVSAKPDSAVYLSEAYSYAKAAIARDPANSANHVLAARIVWPAELSLMPGPDLPMPEVLNEFQRAMIRQSLKHISDAIELDGQDIRLRLSYAAMLIPAGDGDECITQIDAAEHINESIDDKSVFKLDGNQKRQISILRLKAAQLIARHDK